MAVWDRLSVADLPSWIWSHQETEPPPAFRLQHPSRARDVGVEDSVRRELAEWEAAIRRRDDSGVFEIRIPRTPRAGQAWTERPNVLVTPILTAAFNEDPRLFVSREAPASEVVLTEFESEIGDLRIPVIGPGGRVTVYDSWESVDADLVVRKRIGEVACRWRQPDSLLRRILDEVGGAPERVTLSATFGYFELSKYEPQAWLRPTFALILDYEATDEAGPGWRRTIIEPATIGEEISGDEGLGSWSE